MSAIAKLELSLVEFRAFARRSRGPASSDENRAMDAVSADFSALAAELATPTLRDQLAMRAPIALRDALVISPYGPVASIGMLTIEQRADVFRVLARLRYEYADTMLAAREAPP